MKHIINFIAIDHNDDGDDEDDDYLLDEYLID